MAGWPMPFSRAIRRHPPLPAATLLPRFRPSVLRRKDGPPRKGGRSCREFPGQRRYSSAPPAAERLSHVQKRDRPQSLYYTTRSSSGNAQAISGLVCYVPSGRQAVTFSPTSHCLFSRHSTHPPPRSSYSIYLFTKITLFTFKSCPRWKPTGRVRSKIRTPDAVRSRPYPSPTPGQACSRRDNAVCQSDVWVPIVAPDLKIPHRDPHGVHIRPRGHEIPQPRQALVAENRIAIGVIASVHDGSRKNGWGGHRAGGRGGGWGGEPTPRISVQSISVGGLQIRHARCYVPTAE